MATESGSVLERDIVIKWSGQEMSFSVASGSTVGELKRKIAEQTSVQPKRQKLLGLKAKVRLLSYRSVVSALFNIAWFSFNSL